MELDLKSKNLNEINEIIEQKIKELENITLAVEQEEVIIPGISR